jgi:hypothetical protein
MSELKRCYNNYTNSVLRVNPLFQRINNISKKKEIIGVCWDTDVLGDYWRNPNNIKKGEMIILKEPSKRVQTTYKGEPLYEIKEVIDDWYEFINLNHITHKNNGYRRYGWENYCD